MFFKIFNQFRKIRASIRPGIITLSQYCTINRDIKLFIYKHWITSMVQVSPKMNFRCNCDIL